MKVFSCPVCNSTKHKGLFTGRNRRDNIDCSGSYVQCRECSLVYLGERLPWEEIVRFYSVSSPDIAFDDGQADSTELIPQAQKAAPKWKRLLRKVRFRPHSWPVESASCGRDRLLDIGCGRGTKLCEFARRGYDIWGVDIGWQAVAHCRELLPQGHFIQGELQQINLPAAHFDFIRIDNALEHVPNPQEVVKECYRLLRNKGQLFTYVPHGRSLSMRFMKGNSISSWIPFHLQLFTRKALYRLMENAGFTDIHIYGYNPVSWLPLSLMQWKYRKEPAPKPGYPLWLKFMCYPIGWLASKLGLAEELVGIGRKDGPGASARKDLRL